MITGLAVREESLISPCIVLHTIAPKQALKGVHLLVLPKEKLPGGDTEVTSFGAVSSRPCRHRRVTSLALSLLYSFAHQLPSLARTARAMQAGDQLRTKVWPWESVMDTTPKHLRGCEGHHGQSVGTQAKHSPSEFRRGAEGLPGNRSVTGSRAARMQRGKSLILPKMHRSM